VFSEPETHARDYYDKLKTHNYSSRDFNTSYVASTFIDSIGHTVITIELKNEYNKGVIGPPLIPLIPHKTGYGHPDDKKKPLPGEMDDHLIMDFRIKLAEYDSFSFTPDSFYIVLTAKQNAQAKVTSVTNAINITQTIRSSDTARKNNFVLWEIEFSPGVHVEDLPKLFITSLRINNTPFHPEGIQFKRGKKSHYSPLEGF
jgi:hypothetical protein